jgi:hypothetical protein
MTEPGEFALFASIGITSIAIFFGPIGKAVGRRIAGGGLSAGQVTGETRVELEDLMARMHDVEAECARLADVETRLDFAERMLAQQRPVAALGDGDGA